MIVKVCDRCGAKEFETTFHSCLVPDYVLVPSFARFSHNFQDGKFYGKKIDLCHHCAECLKNNLDIWFQEKEEGAV